MQIYELTSKRKSPVNEINFGAVGKAIANKAATAALTKLGSNLGVGDKLVPQSAQVATTGAQGAAQQASTQVIAQQAKAGLEMWNKIIQDMTTRARVQQFSQIDPRQREQALVDLINKKMLGKSNISDYKKLTQVVDPKSFNGAGAQKAQEAISNIDAAIQNILAIDPARAKNDTQQLNDWKALSQAVYNAMSISQFQAGAGVGVATVNDPKTQAAIAALGITPAGLAQFNALVKRSGGDPTQYIQGLLKAAKL